MSAEKESETNKMAFVLGYTGETGKALIREMSKRKLFKKVVLIGRREVKLDKDINLEFVS
jgi:oxidoreductase